MTLFKADSKIWQGAFFCFVLAGCTGFLYRVGMIGPLPFDLSLQNIRHAHSHLMFFGWASLLPLYFIYNAVRLKTSSSRGTDIGIVLMKYSLWAVLVFGLLSYPFFLLWGYHPVPISSGALPLSVILSGLVMIAWYFFIAGFLLLKKSSESTASNPWFESGLVLLVISSLGAWGVAILQAFQPENHLLATAMTHFFLSSFTEGWVVLVLMGVVADFLNFRLEKSPVPVNWSVSLVALGAPLTFPYGISESLLTVPLLITARIGGIMVAAGILLFIFPLFKKKSIRITFWAWPLGLFAIKGIIQILASVLPSDFWFSDHSLRIFYLHLLLLGAFSLTLIARMHAQAGLSIKPFLGVSISVVILLFSLLLPTRFLPAVMWGEWIFYALAGAALLPVIAVFFEWIKLYKKMKTENINEP